jgi:hypothetical protein
MLTVRSGRAQADQPWMPSQLTVLDNLRNLMGSRFAHRVEEALPRVRAYLQENLGKSGKSADKELLRRATALMIECQDALGELIETHFNQRFDDKLDCPEDAISHTGQFSADALRMIEQLGMQEDFELELCVGRLREHCQAELPRVAVALRNLLERRTLPESHNPLFPRLFLRSLLDALNEFDCDAATRRAVFRAYCFVLPRIMTDIYAKALKLLAAGVTEESTATGSAFVHAARVA